MSSPDDAWLGIQFNQDSQKWEIVDEHGNPVYWNLSTKKEAIKMKKQIQQAWHEEVLANT